MQNLTVIFHKLSVNVLQDNSQTQIHETAKTTTPFWSTENAVNYCLTLQYINNLVTTQSFLKPAKPVKIYLRDSAVLFI